MSLDTVERMKRVASLLAEAQELAAQGPLTYYLGKLTEQSEALLTKYAPIKAGERAVITRKVPCEAGWKGSEKTLAVGAAGVVNGVDYRDGHFVFTFVPDKQFYKHKDGYKESQTKYSFALHEKYLAKQSPIAEDERYDHALETIKHLRESNKRLRKALNEARSILSNPEV